MIANGGSNLFYVGNHERETIRRLVRSLQQAPFGGVIFSREKIEGTFPLAQVHIDVAGGPDVVVASRWDDRANDADANGRIDASGTSEKYLATHGTLSRFDMHNTLIAAGPQTLEALRDLPGGRWQQHLRLSKIESSVYLDEGDGAFTPSPDAE